MRLIMGAPSQRARPKASMAAITAPSHVHRNPIHRPKAMPFAIAIVSAGRGRNETMIIAQIDRSGAQGPACATNASYRSASQRKDQKVGSKNSIVNGAFAFITNDHCRCSMVKRKLNALDCAVGGPNGPAKTAKGFLQRDKCLRRPKRFR